MMHRRSVLVAAARASAETRGAKLLLKRGEHFARTLITAPSKSLAPCPVQIGLASLLKSPGDRRDFLQRLQGDQGRARSLHL